MWAGRGRRGKSGRTVLRVSRPSFSWWPSVSMIRCCWRTQMPIGCGSPWPSSPRSSTIDHSSTRQSSFFSTRSTSLNPNLPPPPSKPSSRLHWWSLLRSGCQYFKSLFLALDRSGSNRMYVHFTCATDTQQIKFVMEAVNDIFIQTNLRAAGLL